jgi:hypothetical protein
MKGKIMSKISLISAEYGRRLLAELPDDGKVGRLYNLKVGNSGGFEFALWARRCTIKNEVSGGVVIGGRIMACPLGYSKKTPIEKRLRPGWSDDKFVHTAARIFSELHGEAYRIARCVELNEICLAGDPGFDDLVIRTSQKSGRPSEYAEMTVSDVIFWEDEIRKYEEVEDEQ